MHSGLHIPFGAYKILPFAFITDHHDFHHSKNLGNYGSTFTFMDRIFGTDDDYFEYMASIGKC